MLQPEVLYGCSLRGLTSAVRHERALFGRVSKAVEAELAVHKAAPAPGSPGGQAVRAGLGMGRAAKRGKK